VIAVLVTLAVAAVVGGLWRARQGRFHPRRGRTISSATQPAAPDEAVSELVDRLGIELGARATLVQFSTAFCQPCRATRRVLGRVTEAVPGVTHLEVDAEANLGAVRALGIHSTPTTLILDPSGRELRRATGTPRLEHVLAALGEAADAAGGDTRLDGSPR
jgi:thiol-disulfide isomerase/thioredoxin